MAAKASVMPERDRTRSIISRLAEDARPSGQRWLRAWTASVAPGSSGNSDLVELLHPSHHHAVDVCRRERHGQHVVHIGGPLRRAHPDHRLRRIVSPMATFAVNDLFFGVVPELLGIDEHTIKVEDHGLRH